MRASQASQSAPPRGLAAVFGLGLLAGCLEAEPSPAPTSRCASCHGDERNGASLLEQAAPPGDLLGGTEPSSPGVGAHQNHLRASLTHVPVACSECHVVPDSVESRGHADSDGPAELVPGALARAGGYAPAYDSTSHTCSTVYCHLGSSPVWTEPRTSEEACGSCHGSPPSEPHPSSTDCAHCHAAVMADGTRFLEPALHVDGLIDLPEDCQGCHGHDETGAPPVDLGGFTEVTSLGVGAHAAHLRGGAYSRPVACQTCHLVPETVWSRTHLDGAPHAEVRLGGMAALGGRRPTWNRETATCSGGYCHGPSAGYSASGLAWTRVYDAPLACDTCHALPPSNPHPPSDECAVCHAAVVGGAPGNLVILAPELHINGQVEVF